MADIFGAAPKRRASNYQVPTEGGGRIYKLPLPSDPKGPGKRWTSATTFAGTIAETFALQQWSQRMVALGMGRRPDLCALASAAEDDDNKTLQDIARKAIDAGGGTRGSTMGSAYHRFTEVAEDGRIHEVPEEYRPDIQAYLDKLQAARLTTAPELTEQIVVLPEFMLAGQLDRILRTVSNQLLIGDVKTARYVDYSYGEIAIQLAIYANATHIWDPQTETFRAMPPVRKDKAVVMWVPVGRGQCELISIDIAQGYRMLQTCATVRKWRSQSKALASPYQDLSPQSWEDQLKSATSKEQMSAIFQTANAKGEWTESLAELGKATLRGLAD